MANIQFGGLITGLDTNALVAGLVQAERRSITVLQNQRVRFQAQDAVFTSVIGALGRLKASAQSLAQEADFNKRTANSSDPTKLTVSASSAASLGSSLIAIDSLARPQSIQSIGFTELSASVGTGTVTLFKNGTSTEVQIDGSNNTLEGLRDAINQSGAPVTATVINVASGSTADYHLVIQSEGTGTANAVTISSALAGGTDPFPFGGQVVQSATDAVFAVNGLRITRSTNTISDVIPGVTFTLLEEGDQDGGISATDPVTKITINADKSEVTKSISDFIDNFNAVNEIVNDQFALDPNSNRQGSTAGDAAVRAVLSSLRKELSAAGGKGVYAYLSDLGMNFEKNGSLSFNERKLEAALEKDATAVSSLFVAAQNGIGKRLPDMIDNFISTIDGSLAIRQKGVGQSIKQIDDKIAREEARIAKLEDQLIRKFSALEELVSQLKSRGDFLAQQLSALQNARTK
jgi:flagellar hook-associated protein 2